MFFDFARILYYSSSLYYTSAYLSIDSLTERIWFKNYLERAHALPSAIFGMCSLFTLRCRKNTVRLQKSFGISLCSNQSAKKDRALLNIIDYLLLTGDVLFNYLIIFYRLLCGVAKHTKLIYSTQPHIQTALTIRDSHAEPIIN